MINTTYFNSFYNAPVIPITKAINPPNAAGLGIFQRPIVPYTGFSDILKGKQGSGIIDILKKTPSDVKYLVPESMEKRFEDGSTVWNPYYNIEDIYAKKEDWYANIGAGLAKAVPGAVESFMGTFASASDKDFSSTSPIHEWATRSLQQLEEDMPQYWTKEYQDNPGFLNTINGNFSGFVGDKLIKNLGFTVGAIGGAFVVDAALTPIAELTAGATLPTMAAVTGRSLKTAASSISNIFRSIGTGGATAADVVALGKVTKDLNRASKTLTATQGVIQGSKFLYSSYLTSAGEAAVEALGAKDDYETRLIDEYKAKNGTVPTVDELVKFKKNGMALANTTFSYNMPILLLSNALQFGSILYGKNLLRNFNKPVFWDGSKYVTKSLGSKLGKEITLDMITEGGQELAQTLISKGTTERYLQESLLGREAGMYLIDQAKAIQSMSSQEGVESALIGALTGALTAGVGTAASRIAPSKFNGLYTEHKDAQLAAETLNNQVESFESLVKGVAATQRANQALERGDVLNYLDSKHEELFEQVNFFTKNDNFDLWEDRLNALKKLNLDDFNAQTGLKLNEGERLNYVESLLAKSKEINETIKKVEQLSPFIQFRFKPTEVFQQAVKAENPSLTDEEVDEKATLLMIEHMKELRLDLARDISLLSDRKRRAEKLHRKLSKHVQNQSDFETLVVNPKGLKKELLERKSHLEMLLNRENLSRPAAMFEKEFKDELAAINKKLGILDTESNPTKQAIDIFKVDKSILPSSFVKDFEDLKRLRKLQGLQETVVQETIELTQDPQEEIREIETRLENANEAAEQANQEQERIAEVQNEFANRTKENQQRIAHGILEKISNNTPLTPKEEIIFKSAKTLIQTLAGEHEIKLRSQAVEPEVKPEVTKDSSSSETLKTSETLESKKADIERRRQEEIDNLFSKTQAAVDKQLNTPVEKISKEEIDKIIKEVKEKNKDLIAELETPDFLNSKEREEEWDKKGDDLSNKLPKSISWKVVDGKIEFFDNQDYREKGFGTRNIVAIEVHTIHKKSERFEIGDTVQVRDGMRAIPATVTKVNENGKILEARDHNGKLVISKGNIISLAPIDEVIKINAKYDTELKALEKADIKTPLKEVINKKVLYKGRIGVLRFNPENAIFEIETDNVIYELSDAFENSSIEDFNIKKYEKDLILEKKPKYNIVINSENTVSVNSIVYNMVLDNRGNIAYLIPLNNKTQKIKNEQLLIAIEIERNKNLTPQIKTLTLKVKSQKPEKNVNIKNVVNNLLAIGYDNAIDQSIDNLLNGNTISRNKLKNLTKWVYSKYERLEKLIEEYSDSSLKETFDNINHLKNLLEQSKKEEKFRITDITEDSVIVNGIKYRLEIDNKGNVVSLINGSTKLKSERLLVEVEIERNKIIYKNVNTISESNKELIYNETLSNNKSAFILNEIWSVNFTDTVAEALDLLYQDDTLNDTQALQLHLWLSEVIYNIEKELEKNTNDFVLFNGWETLLLIQESLYKQRENENKNFAKPVINSTAKSRHKRNKNNKRSNSKITRVNTEQITPLLELSDSSLEKSLSVKDYSFVKEEIERLLTIAQNLKNSETGINQILEGVDFLITEYQDKINLDDLIKVRNLIQSSLKEEEYLEFEENKTSTNLIEETEFTQSTIGKLNKENNLDLFLTQENNLSKKQKELVTSWYNNNMITIIC